jgi:hypothetical protein
MFFRFLMTSFQKKSAHIFYPQILHNLTYINQEKLVIPNLTIQVLIIFYNAYFLALDSQQILNQTGIQQVSLVEKDSKAVISRVPKKQSEDKIEKAPSGNGKAPSGNGMVTSTMPSYTNQNNPQQTKTQAPESETTCWCFEKKKQVKPRNVNLSMQENRSDLEEPMLSQ